MPTCGTLSIPPGYIERLIPNTNNVCIIAPSWSPIATEPLYHSAQFVSTNPNALVTVESTARGSGEVTRSFGTAQAGYIGSICVRNCPGGGYFGFGGAFGQLLGQVARIGSEIAFAVSPFAPYYAAGRAAAETAERSQKGMALNLSGLLGTAGSILGGINTSGYGDFTKILGGGLQIAGAAFAPQPSAQPVYGIQPYTQAQPVMATRPMAQGAVTAIGSAGMSLSVGAAAVAAAKALLPKIAAALGRRGITLSNAVDVARKLGKFFASPEAIALYMGLSVAELAQLITAHAARKRRRMNPANAHALRRAARRIKSFHRLCTHTDLIKTRRSRTVSVGARCGTCRKSPCRC